VFLPDAVERYGAHKYGKEWTGQEASAFSRWLTDPHGDKRGDVGDDEVAAGYRWRDAVNVLREHLYSATLAAHVFSRGTTKPIPDPSGFGDDKTAWVRLLAGVPFIYKEELAHPDPGVDLGPSIVQEREFWAAVSLTTTSGMKEANAWVVVPDEELGALLGQIDREPTQDKAAATKKEKRKGGRKAGAYYRPLRKYLETLHTQKPELFESASLKYLCDDARSYLVRNNVKGIPRSRNGIEEPIRRIRAEILKS
jgi:hypothetical protein